MHGSIPHTLTISTLFAEWQALGTTVAELQAEMPPEGCEPEDLELPMLTAALAQSVRRCLLRKMVSSRPKDARESLMLLWAYTDAGKTQAPPFGSDFWRDVGQLMGSSE